MQFNCSHDVIADLYPNVTHGWEFVLRTNVTNNPSHTDTFRDSG